MPLGGMLTGGIISGIGSIFGGIFGSSAAKKQLQAEQQAQHEIEQSREKALSYQTDIQGRNQANLSPFLQSGQAATGTLRDLLATPGQGLLTPWAQKFQAPTAEEAAKTPGYQFQLEQGLKGVQSGAAAQGGLLSGGTLAALNNYAQGAASTNYQNTFQNALTQYNSAYQTFLNNQANQYGMLSGQQGMGLQAGQTLGGLNQAAAQNYGGITTSTGQDIASLMAKQGATRAGGTMAVGNAISSGLNNFGNLMSGYGMLRQMNGQSQPDQITSSGGLTWMGYPGGSAAVQ